MLEPISAPPARTFRRVSRGAHFEESMTTERIVRIFAGTFVLVSLALGLAGSPLFVSSRFLWLTAFVGANLFQSGFTRFCPLEIVLRKAGLPAAAGGRANAREDVRGASAG